MLFIHSAVVLVSLVAWLRALSLMPYCWGLLGCWWRFEALTVCGEVWIAQEAGNNDLGKLYIHTALVYIWCLVFMRVIVLDVRVPKRNIQYRVI